MLLEENCITLDLATVSLKIQTKSRDRKKKKGQAVVAHAFIPCNEEAEAGRSCSSRSVWSTRVPEQLGLLHKETLSSKTKNKKE